MEWTFKRKEKKYNNHKINVHFGGAMSSNDEKNERSGKNLLFFKWPIY